MELDDEKEGKIKKIGALLGSTDENTRRRSTRRLGKASASLLPLLLKGLASEDPEVRVSSLKGLEVLGEKAEAALAEIENCRYDKVRAVRDAAKRAYEAVNASRDWVENLIDKLP